MFFLVLWSTVNTFIGLMLFRMLLLDRMTGQQLIWIFIGAGFCAPAIYWSPAWQSFAFGTITTIIWASIVFYDLSRARPEQVES